MHGLIVNKFLYPNGGSETYIFEIGKQLESMGHEVQYFGMEHEGRIVGNHAESYTSSVDFHTGKLDKLLYPFKIIYSVEAREKIRKVLEDFVPDVVHLNNFNFQLTPSIIYEIKAYEKQRGRKVRLVFTAHDYQIVCPNHMMTIPSTNENCARCLEGNFFECMKHRCIHNSKIKSMLGSMEGWLYRKLCTYRYLDCIICPSYFLKEKLNRNYLLSGKMVVMHNFVEISERAQKQKREYILYFGRYSEEKGVRTLLKVCRRVSEIPFVFAGSGPLETEVNEVKNVKNMGFLKGDKLYQLISGAAFSVYPSEWYENCPFSVIESISLGTPVIGAKIGGIPELIEEEITGELFEAGNADDLERAIRHILFTPGILQEYTENCYNAQYETSASYYEKLMKIYEGK